MPTLSLPTAVQPIWQRMKDARAMYAAEPLRVRFPERLSFGPWMRASGVSRRSRGETSVDSSASGTSWRSNRAPSVVESSRSTAMALEGSSDLNEYEIRGVLGRGTFAVVKLARHLRTSKSVAIKIVSKDMIVEMKQEKNILREQTVHLLLHHPFVSKLYTTYQDKDALYFVVEYCPGGELYSLVYAQDEDDDVEVAATESESEDDEIAQSGDNNYSGRSKDSHVGSVNQAAKKALRSAFGGLYEQHVAFYLGCLTLGLEYLHGMNILYRDLKLENLVLDVDGYPKLVDFGLSKPDAARNDRNSTMCGSMEYMAPEVLQHQPYDLRADLWSFGIIMYELLFGTTPFYHANRREQGRRITMEPVPFPNNFEEEHTEACALINSLLSKNPAERPTSFEHVKSSSFFRKYFPTPASWRLLEMKKHPSGAPFVPVLDGAFDMSLFAPLGDGDDEYDNY